MQHSQHPSVKSRLFNKVRTCSTISANARTIRQVTNMTCAHPMKMVRLAGASARGLAALSMAVIYS